jgi:hypothetical protein
MSAGRFLQFSPDAREVGQLKGLGGKVGGSVGEDVVYGGDLIFGEDYWGLEGNWGVGGGLPAEIHGGATITCGWDSHNGWK